MDAWELPGSPRARRALIYGTANNKRLEKYTAAMAEVARANNVPFVDLFHASRDLYARAVTTGEIRTALACLQDEADLLGLYPPKKVAPTDPTGNSSRSAMQPWTPPIRRP